MPPSSFQSVLLLLTRAAVLLLLAGAPLTMAAVLLLLAAALLTMVVLGSWPACPLLPDELCIALRSVRVLQTSGVVALRIGAAGAAACCQRG